MRVAASLRAAVQGLEIPHLGSVVSDQVTLSIGVASRVPGAHQGPEILVAAADGAFTGPRRSGRNRAVASEPGVGEVFLVFDPKSETILATVH